MSRPAEVRAALSLELYGVTPVLHARGGRWHEAVQEVFACDFRGLDAGDEADYWPHRGIPRPEEVSGLADWWQSQVAA